jgi:predicted Zn-dependent protease
MLRPAIGGAGVAANAVTMGSMAAGQSVMLAYSREDEMQADQMGLKYLNNSGYSGKGLITLLEKIRSKQWFGSKQIPTYLTTHPASEDRIVYVDSWLAQNPRPEKKGDTYAFRRARTFLIANYEDKNASFRKFERAVRENSEDSLAHYGYGLVLSRAGDREKAAVHIKAALESNAFDAYILKDLGKIYFLEGKYKQALNILENVLSINPGNPDGLYYLGLSQMELGKLEDAVISLTKLTKKYPRFAPGFYSLGEAYGKKNKLTEAHFYLGIYYTKTGNLKNARFHLKRALKDMDDPEKKRQIEKMLKKISKMIQKTG